MLRPASAAAAALCVAAAISGLTACGDPLRLQAHDATRTDTLVVYAMSGTAPIYPSALNTGSLSVVRTDGSFTYDVAFDLDASGQVVLYPIKLIGGSYVSNRRVGLQKASTSFDALERAPASGYQYDSTTVVTPGQAVAVEVTDPVACQLQFSSLLYSKLVVDSVDTRQRAIYFRALHDPNCGFRGLTTGVPKN